MRTPTSLALFALLAACSTPEDRTDAVAGEVAEHLSGMVVVSDQVETLGHQLVQPTFADPLAEPTADSCAQVAEALASTCRTVIERGLAPQCASQATYFLAHTTPRCAGRVEVPAPDAADLHAILAFDLAGRATGGGGPSCGNGVIEGGEQCDDGNAEVFDGCDATCQLEEFQGCERVVEEKFQAAQVAWIDRSQWAGPRSHLMIHGRAAALRPVSAATCGEARAAADAACAQLRLDMPFVGACAAATHFGADDAGDFCAVRMTVGFQATAADFGIFTTALPGVLAFTIR